MIGLRHAIASAAISCALFFSAAASALSVEPIVIEMTPIGQRSTAAISVTNERARATTVEVSVNTLTVPTTGEPQLEPIAGDEFLVFPPQAIIGPGETQVFRVRWVGDPEVNVSQLYMFTTSELPIDLENPAGVETVQILYSINSLVIIQPMEGAPRLSTADVRRAVRGEEPGVELTVRNDSNMHGYLSMAHVDLVIDEPERWSMRLRRELMGEAIGLGLIPALSERTIFIPVSDIPSTGEIAAEIIMAGN